MKPPDSDKLYTFADLTAYDLRQRTLIRAADIGFYSLIKAVGRTVRFERGQAGIVDLLAAEGRTPIFATWHDRIFLGTYLLQKRGIVFLTSQSFDGEYIARFLQRFGFGVIRGSSTRGGARGLVQMVRELKRGVPMGFTVDGPKGPRYRAKPGPILLAKKSGEPVLPFIVEPASYATVSSWDKLQIPRPFTRAKAMFGEPIYVPPTADDAALNEKLRELQSSLDDLTERGERWRAGL